MPAAGFRCYEQQNSRTWSYDAGKVTTSRTFKVAEDGGSLGSPYDVRQWFGIAVGASVGLVSNIGPDALPQKGDLFPGETGIWAKSYSVTREPNTDLWTVVWTYSNAQVTSVSAQPGEPGFVEWTLDIQAQFAETYILDPTYPTDGTPATAATSQVTGGVQIDVEGTPLSQLRYTSELVINETIQSISGVPSIVTQVRAARGKRNNASWEGFAKGTALYTGASIRRIGVSLYTVSHRIVESSDYHLVQFPDRDSSGKIPTAEINGGQRAKKVFWRQPFPSLYDFTAISANW